MWKRPPPATPERYRLPSRAQKLWPEVLPDARPSSRARGRAPIAPLPVMRMDLLAPPDSISQKSPNLAPGQNLFLCARFATRAPLWTVLPREAPPLLLPESVSYHALSTCVSGPPESRGWGLGSGEATWPRRILGAVVPAQAQTYAGAGCLVSAGLRRGSAFTVAGVAGVVS